MSFPEHIKPMLAVASSPFDDSDCAFEVKWDGLRCIAFLGEKTRLQARSLSDYTLRFPELSSLHECLARGHRVLDGEIVCFADGKPSFLRLIPRVHARPDTTTALSISRRWPAVFIAFDVLYREDTSVMNLPLTDRRELLEASICPSSSLQLSPLSPAAGKEFFEAARGLGLEGVVGKVWTSPYLQGRRSRYWRKVKALHIEPFVICGYMANPAGRTDLSALGIAAHVDDELVYFGLVGSGLAQAEIDRLLGLLQLSRLAKTAEAPVVSRSSALPRGMLWVSPFFVCDVEYLEVTEDMRLRHPVYKGLRADLQPSDCRKE